jgi:hypothetical protein
VATNVVRDHWRSAGQRRRGAEVSPEVGGAHLLPHPDPDVAAVLEHDEELRAVWAALDEVSTEDREIILLRDFEELPTAEIATICRKHDVPVYPCVSASGMMRRAPFGGGQLYGIEGWRATAANAFAQGADGVSLFNLFPAPGSDAHNRLVRQAFSELGDPATLAGKDKLFVLDNEAHMATHGYVNHIVPPLPANHHRAVTFIQAFRHGALGSFDGPDFHSGTPASGQ